MIIEGGYYIKARCIKNSAVAHAPPYVREIWDYLLRNANHSERKYNGFVIKRGQLFRSYREIRDDLHWKVGYRKERYNENQMKMGMRYLMKQLMITLTKQPRGNIITICNYDFYQDPSNYDATNDITSDTTNAQPMHNQGVLSINKNVKNIRIKDSDIHIPKRVKKEPKKFIPPTLEEAKAFFKENGFSEDAAETAWKYYSEGDWHNSVGKQVQSWRQTFRGVWFRPENKEGGNNAKGKRRDGREYDPDGTKFASLGTEAANEPDCAVTTSIHPEGGKGISA